MPRWIYTLVLRLLLPFAVLWFLLRAWRHAAYRGQLREPLSIRCAVRHDRPLWVHAASVGEVQALAGLLRGAAQSPAPAPLLLTVGTPTGLARAQELYRDLLQLNPDGRPQLTVQLAPWDLPGAAARFLRASRPRAAVFVETELWPNLIAACARQRVPPVLVSARVSEKSLRRYLRLAPRMMQKAVRAFAAISVQGEVDRQRFIALGAESSRVTVGGNLKFDLPLPAGIVEQGARLRAETGPRPLWVAGSTHPVEEDICVRAQRRLVAGARDAGRPLPLLVLAPRRPERFAGVVQWLDAQQMKYARSSQPAADRTGIEVLLLDVMGELLPWYAAADAAFVGGTLVPVGGHNLLEPAALGKPVIAGPHRFNSPAVAELLESAGALATVTDAAQLTQVLESFLGDAKAAQATGARAAAVVAANRGAAGRALQIISALPPAA